MLTNDLNMKQTIFFLSNLTVFLCYGFLSHAQGNRGDNIAGLEHMQIRIDFNKYFDSCGVAGSTMIYDIAAQQWIVSDTVGINRETLPASTFKIINLLIALETNAIKDEHELISWPGTTDTVKYGLRPDIYHDMSVKEAFELSAGWVFVSLAHTIGVETYRKYLLASGYGNGSLTHSDIDFWNFGGFGISPVNQVAFLYGLYNETLPFSQRNMRIVKDVMVAEQAANYTIREDRLDS